MIWLTVALLSIVCIVFYLYMTRNFNYWKERGVKFEPPYPFFGSAAGLFLSWIAAGPLLERIHNYAPNEPFVGFFTFDKPMLLIRDPEVIKNILVKDFHYFKDRFARTCPHEKIASSGLFMIKNPAWKYLRTKLSPLYTSVRLRKMFERMIEVASDLDTFMKSLNLGGSGKELEVKEICSKFTTDMIGITAYGLKVNSLNNPNAEFRKQGQAIFKASFLRNLEITSFFFTPDWAERLGIMWFSKEATTLLRSALWSTLNEREQSGVKQTDLIDILIELKNSERDSPEKHIFEFEGDNVVAQPAIFFTAGFETSSTLLSFTLYELAVNPEIQNRLRKDITQALQQNNGLITYDMVKGLPYLDNVMSETLRKYPPLPFLDRIADADYQVPGTDLVIEKGTPVFISLTALQSDPQYHHNPKKYDPERFSGENKESMKSVYMPFGDGPRSCIGMRLGMLQSKLGLLKMLPKYEFSPCKDTLIPMRFSNKGLMTTSESGIVLNVRKIIE